MDVLDKLKIMADLPAGSFLPKEICPDGGTNRWDIVISNLCRDAAREITTLRDFRQASIKALAQAYKDRPELVPGTANGDINVVPYKEWDGKPVVVKLNRTRLSVKDESWGSPFAMNFGEKK